VYKASIDSYNPVTFVETKEYKYGVMFCFADPIESVITANLKMSVSRNLTADPTIRVPVDANYISLTYDKFDSLPSQTLFREK